MTELLLETGLDARQRDYAETVRNSGEALVTIISDILDFSKIEAGMLELEDIEYNQRTVVDDVVDLLTGQAQAKGLELVASIESSIPAMVNGDPGRVRQVLTNLLGNAIKFTQAGNVIVRVSEAEPVDADIRLRFEVSDTGDGIAPDKSWTRSSNRLSRPTTPPAASTVDRVWDSPSVRSWFRSWGVSVE
jgi:signal transduction histidine kinase